MKTTLFGQPEIEALKHYVYCLVDPRDKCIFYVGKGKGNRVFDHARDALTLEDETLKLNKIRDIISLGLSVEHYILRHGIEDANEALRLESSIIDLLTYPAFNTERILTNIVAGHHQWDEGIKTTNEIKQIYMCEKISLKTGHKVLMVNLNKSYDQKNADGEYIRPNIYEATRKFWHLNKAKADEVDYVLGVYRGVVRIVIKPTSKWQLATSDEEGYPVNSKTSRYKIEGTTNDTEGNSLYLHKDVKEYPFSQNPIQYIQFAGDNE